MEFSNLNLLLRYAKEYGHSHIKKAGVTDTEHIICAFLFGHANSSQDEVAQALKLDKTTVARALQTLEKKGYVDRTPNPHNRRKNTLVITPQGKETIAHIVDVYDAWLGQIASVFTAEEQAQFEQYCQRLLAAAEKIHEEMA